MTPLNQTMHVLLAEDNNVAQMLGTRILERLSCTVSIAADGQQALNYLANPTEPRPDVILMKISMPILDGITATRILRSQPPFATDPILRSTPIVALYGNADHFLDDRQVQQYRVAGFDDVLAKPLRVSSVRKLLLRCSLRRRVVQHQVGVYYKAPVWGPMPLRRYQGPRSLL